MTYYVIIRGPAAVGKTTIGKLLAEKLKAALFSFDKILGKNKLDDLEGKECISEENFFKANNIIIPLVDDELKKDKIVIIEGNFYHLNPLDDLIEQLDYPHFVLTLKASVEECIQRDKTRKELGEENVKDVFKLVARFDKGKIIDTNNKSSVEIVKEIMSIISNSDFN